MSCGQGHPLSSCPVVNFLPNRQLLILRRTFSRPQERRAWPRRKRNGNQWTGSLGNCKKVKHNAFKIRFDPGVMAVFRSFETEPQAPKGAESTRTLQEIKKVSSCQDFAQLPPGRTFGLRRMGSLRNGVKSMEEAFEGPREPRVEKVLSWDELREEAGMGLGKLRKQKESRHNLQQLVHENVGLLLLGARSKSNEEELDSPALVPKEGNMAMAESLGFEKIAVDAAGRDRTPGVRFLPLSSKIEEVARQLESESGEEEKLAETAAHSGRAAPRVPTSKTLKTLVSSSALEKLERKAPDRERELFWYEFESARDYKGYFDAGNMKDLRLRRRTLRRDAVLPEPGTAKRSSRMARSRK